MKTYLVLAALAFGGASMASAPALADTALIYSPASKSWITVQTGKMKKSNLGQAIHDANGTQIWTCAPSSHGQVGRCYPTKAVMQQSN